MTVKTMRRANRETSFSYENRGKTVHKISLSVRCAEERFQRDRTHRSSTPCGKRRKSIRLYKCLVEGNGVRATARIVGVNKDTWTVEELFMFRTY